MALGTYLNLSQYSSHFWLCSGCPFTPIDYLLHSESPLKSVTDTLLLHFVLAYFLHLIMFDKSKHIVFNYLTNRLRCSMQIFVMILVDTLATCQCSEA